MLCMSQTSATAFCEKFRGGLAVMYIAVVNLDTLEGDLYSRGLGLTGKSKDGWRSVADLT